MFYALATRKIRSSLVEFRHVLEDTRISQEADNPQMIKRGAKATAR